MPKNGTEFSRYATAFHEILDGYMTKQTLFTKDLIKMGLTPEDIDTIDNMFPTLTNEKGISFFEASKYSQLNKYYHGINDLTQLLPKLETEFDSDFNERYCDELQDYDESRIMAFARVLNIDVNEDAIDIVSEAIANYYSSIVIGSATKKKTTTKTSKVIRLIIHPLRQVFRA